MKQIYQVSLILFMFFIAACGGGGGSTAGDSSLIIAPVDENGNPEEETVTNAAFYVRAWDEGNYDFVMWSPDTTDGACEIALDATGEDIVCILDVQERDLWFHGARLQYNIPASMCTYLRSEPYWYYYYEPGAGPTQVDLSWDEDINGDYQDGTLDCDDGTGAINNVNECVFDELTVIMNGNNPELRCAYNHTFDEVEGPNCCYGPYTLTTLVGADFETTETDWGGFENLNECIEGPGANNWETRDALTSLPIVDFQYISGVGVNKIYDITAPKLAGQIFTNLNHNLYAANYFDYTGTSHTHDGYVSATTSNWPYAVNPIDDRNGSFVPSGQAFYDFSCMDEASEVKNRIRVLIREWNTNTEFQSFYTLAAVDTFGFPTVDPSTSTADPDVEGFNESACGTMDVDGNFCNDLSDWGDILLNLSNAPAVTYDTDPLNPEDRAEFFPNANRQFGPYND